ncbi:hypothetical protein [Paenibacillus sp. FSL R7-0179]|uniref:hypothetical protein n=1 Tax=Paenibacillus sp. FSL R7-0179 TaxID=2921672 RepID=UPI0030F85C1A
MTLLTDITATADFEIKYQSFTTLEGNLPEQMRFVTRQSPLLLCVGYKFALSKRSSEAPNNIRSINQAIIHDVPPMLSQGAPSAHSVKVQFPSVVLNSESMALKVCAAIVQAVYTISQNVYAEGDYSLTDTVRMILAKEINAAFAKVIWNTSVPIVHSGVTESFWYQGQLLADFRMPIMAIWRHKPIHSPSLDDMPYLVA